MLIYERNVVRKFQISILIRSEENCVINIFTFLLFVANRQTDGKNIYRIDAHM